MEERRRLERYALRTATTVEADQESGRPQLYHVVTRDVSSGGAFVVTPEPLAEGKTVRMEMLLPFDTLTRMLGKSGKVLVSVQGTVVRTDERGMAVAFSGKHRISLTENVFSG